MYVWDVQRLKRDLVTSGLPPALDLLHVLFVLVAVSLTFVSVPEHNLWSAVFGACVIGLLVTGTVFAYRCNGGATGHRFLSRYFALAWVCGVRWVVIVVVPLTIIAVLIPGSRWTLVLPGETPPLAPFDVFMRTVVLPLLFWRIGVHLRHVAAAPVPEELPGSTSGDGLPLEPLED